MAHPEESPKETGIVPLPKLADKDATRQVCREPLACTRFQQDRSGPRPAAGNRLEEHIA